MENKYSTRQEYLKRLNTVVEFINNNLDRKIIISELAEISNFSPYHFHRIMKGLLGEPIGSFITRKRIETAARLIRYTDIEIQDIAYSVGYDSPSSLNKIFKQYYNISPTEYRNNTNSLIMNSNINKLEIKLKNPKILEIEDKFTIYINIKGEYGNPNYQKTWERLWSFVKEKKLFTKGIESIGMSYDDPKLTEAEKCRYDACLVIHKTAVPEGEVGVKTIKGGKFAIFLYQGSYQNLSKVYDYIFGSWLINSDYELRNEPVMEKYLNNPNRTIPEKLKTEIYLPIK
ncbi:MAG: AraC family transcriptional regulator [Marinifilaceae bacterium]|jgi:AraC family transcriptional regulator|nr:AraC family transcriptional regulator [Marinifilaceae bacterium]